MKKAKTEIQLDKLLFIIEIVNFVPPDIALTSFDRIWHKASNEVGFGEPFDNDRITQKSSEITLEKIADYPLLKHYLEHYDEYFEGGLRKPVYIYDQFLRWREKLNEIAKFTTVFAKRKAKGKKVRTARSAEISCYFSITEEGKIDFTDFFSSSLQGIEAERIRLCEICRRIFWAKRLDKWCCSIKCGQVRRKRIKRKADKQKQQQREKWLSKDFSKKD